MSTGLLIKTNGQTVIATATYQANSFGGPASGNVAFKSDTGLTQAVSLPATINSDTTWYIADANLPRTAALITLVITQIDGSVIYNDTVRLDTGFIRTVEPLPTKEQVAADSGGVFGIVRTPFQVNTGLVTVGTVNSTWFYRVIEGGTISKIRTFVATSSGNIAVAAYRNTGLGLAATPGTRLATSGSIACPTGGLNADVSLGASVNLAVGDWLAIGGDNLTATFVGTTGSGDSTLSAGQCGQEAVYPPSATPTMIPKNNRIITLIGVP